MSEKRTATYTNGTAALKIPQQDYRPREAKIIAFPVSRTTTTIVKAAVDPRPVSSNKAKAETLSPRKPQHAASPERLRVATPDRRHAASPELREKAKARTTPNSRRGVREILRDILLASEMYCSLRYESMLGCPYHLFSKEGIAVLSTGAALIGIVSLILGS